MPMNMPNSYSTVTTMPIMTNYGQPEKRIYITRMQRIWNVGII